MTKPQVLLSGIAPSGRLTLGNYLGAIRNWVGRQHIDECFFPLVDLHAITVRQDPKDFAARCRDFVALYLACGIDAKESVVFVQSHVPAHCELAWILECHTQLGELNRMTQFKDKSRRHERNVNAGLMSYPVLMAADILLYKAPRVPVGEDQRQHLELTRDIAGRFNSLYGPVFPLPEAHIPETGARIMSLGDPTKKMSKSDSVDANVITLLDEPSRIARRIKRSVTDSDNDTRADASKPGVTNLLNILAAATNVSIASLEERFRGQGYGALKTDVADAVIALIEPIQERFRDIRSDTAALDRLLADGRARADERAMRTLREVYDSLGLIPRSASARLGQGFRR